MVKSIVKNNGFHQNTGNLSVMRIQLPNNGGSKERFVDRCPSLGVQSQEDEKRKGLVQRTVSLHQGLCMALVVYFFSSKVYNPIFLCIFSVNSF